VLRHLVSAFAVGLVFGLGLLMSGMASPAKVLAFLDVAGAWDPSLALVMAGAVAVGSIFFAIAGRRATSLLGAPLVLPQRRDIDASLVLGSLGFGVGWGLAGFCPGPAFVALGAAEPKALVFVGAMLVGMALFEVQDRHAKRGAPIPSA
jgi:uncharacterized protein